MAGVTKSDLGQLEVVLDRLFAKSGIDIEFTKHFFDRVNDARNKKPITVEELNKVFTELQSRRKLMNKIKGGGDGFERVLKDATTDINIPFVIKYDSYTRMMELVTKTIMRKKGFKSKDTPFMKISTEGLERTALITIGEGKPKADDKPMSQRRAERGAAGMAATTRGRGGSHERRWSKKKRSKMGARNRDPRKGGYQGEDVGLSEAYKTSDFEYGEYESPESKRVLARDLGHFMALLESAYGIANRHGDMRARDGLSKLSGLYDDAERIAKHFKLSSEAQKAYRKLSIRNSGL